MYSSSGVPHPDPRAALEASESSGTVCCLYTKSGALISAPWAFLAALEANPATREKNLGPSSVSRNNGADVFAPTDDANLGKYASSTVLETGFSSCLGALSASCFPALNESLFDREPPSRNPRTDNVVIRGRKTSENVAIWDRKTSKKTTGLGEGGLARAGEGQRRKTLPASLRKASDVMKKVQRRKNPATEIERNSGGLSSGVVRKGAAKRTLSGQIAAERKKAAKVLLKGKKSKR